MFELAFPKAINYFAKDLQACISGVFNWNDIDIEAIKERATFMQKFTTVFDDPKTKLLMVNTIPLEEIFPLKFIDLITDNPDYTFGKPIYNESLNFYSYLLDFFCKFYLDKDFQVLDRIDAVDIETYSPVARLKLRKKNRLNQFIHDKYFNNEFNLLKFAVKLVEKFVPGASWRWIGGNHQAHIYCVKICRILMEYGLPDESECELIKNVLYLKIQVYKSLEVCISGEVGKIDQYWINLWVTGLTQVRQYYIEILIHYLYLKQDNEISNMMMKIYQQYGENQQNVTKEKLDEILTFNKSIIFEQEFSRKLMDFLLGYVLSQNLINAKLLSNEKIETIADNFLHIFSNIDDPYLHSLRLMEEEDYLNFIKEELNVIRVPLDLEKELSVQSIALKKLIIGFSKGKFYKSEKAVFLELSAFLDKLNEKLDFVTAINNKSPKDIVKQKALFFTNIPMTLTNFMANLVTYHMNELKEINVKENLLMKFSCFMQFFLNNNTSHHSCFFLQENMWILEKMFTFIPMEIADFLYESFSKNSLILMIKDCLLDSISTKMLYNFYAKLLESQTIENFRIFSKLVDILALSVSHQAKKISEWLSEYDIRLSIDLLADYYKEIFDIVEYDTLLKNFKNDKKSLNDEKLLCYMNFLSLASTVSAFRYDDECYKFINEKFPMQELANLIEKSGKRLEFRMIFMELYSNFHVDFKNHLLNNRATYFFTQPDDMQYEEDPFFDKEYEKTMDLLIREFNFMIDLYKAGDKEKVNYEQETFINYVNSTLFGTLIKLMNYFLVIKEGDLSKLSKYIPKLDQIKSFIFGNNEGILYIYGIDADKMSSPERKKYEVELANVDPDLKIKLEKMQIVGSCKIILEACSNIVNHKPLLENKKKLLTAKTPVERTRQEITAIKNFSNKLATRKENINLPFIQAERRKVKFGGKNEVIPLITAYYETNKMVKTGEDLDKNIYIYLLKDEDNVEMMEFGYNLCSFIHNQLAKEWFLDKRNSKFAMIASLINTLFISTGAIQKNLFKVINNSGGTAFLDRIWTEMKVLMNFVKFKTNIDRYWKEAFNRCMILIKFHQYLCEDNNEQFKRYMREKILPGDTIDRVQRWTTIFQKISDNCQWHYNYVKGEINDYERWHRPYLFPLATLVFDNLAELCTGPNKENQKKIYTFIYDRYNGFLRRYWRDVNSEFYQAKLSLLEFIVCMAEGNDPAVLNYQTTNLELTNLFTVIVDSLRQLFYCVARKDKFEKKKMSDYPLYMKDFNEIQSAFLMIPEFYQHTLLEICVKLFSYIRTLAEIKSKYEIFCNEREDMIVYYEKYKKISNSAIKEDDLVVYKFLTRILVKIEIVREIDEETVLIPFYFPISSKCYYISDVSKDKFLENVDRTSCDSKLSGLYGEKNYFKQEMLFNQARYNNRLKLYEYFGTGNYIFFEIFTLILAYVNNFIMVFGNDTSVMAIFIGLEIFLSFVSLILFSYFAFPLARQLNRQRYIENNVTTSELANFWNKLSLDIFDSFLLQKFVWVFLYHIFCVTMGLSYSSVFIAFDLLSTINLFDTMQFILRSVTEHIAQLISTLALSALLMYCFSMIVNFYFLDNVPTYECSNFLSCYFYIMEQAFTNGQGLAGVMSSTDDSTSSSSDMSEFYALFFLDITFFILVNTVLLNIILAILVDTFSGLRQKAESFDKDSKTICFICGIPKYMFEKSGIDFETHVSKEHDIWSYVNFLVFMSEKTEKDCNGVEAEIFENIRTGNLEWFPIHRSITLGKIF